jgi:hypothetical protein
MAVSRSHLQFHSTKALAQSRYLDKGNTYGDAHEIDGHEYEVRLGTDVLDANGPDLGHDDGTNGTAGGGIVEAAGAEGSREDLGIDYQLLRDFQLSRR